MTTLRPRPLRGVPSGWPDSVPVVLQQIYASRGLLHPDNGSKRIADLHPARLLGNIDRAAELLAEAIVTNKRITVAGDYDCDGATGSAVAVRGLRLLGGTNVNFIVPNRFTHGYGLTPALVDAMDPLPEVIVTVDSGVASIEGVAYAKAKGITVIVTDHHLPAETLPNADVIVNPNLKGDPFPSKMLAGVGVMFYVLLVTRNTLRPFSKWAEREPELSTLLDMVALGTVADLVALDQNNRILVEAGLTRIRRGLGNVGVQALINASKCQIDQLVASDIAFSVAPRLNAAGRLEDMRLGVQTLLCDDPVEAAAMVVRLDAINTERRELQADMVASAESIVAQAEAPDTVGVVVSDPTWHAGVVGLVASKLKESLHRPVVAFAPAGADSDEVRGSGRSIAGFHLRDALALINTQHPGLILKFGGHAMAAGLSLKAADIPKFAEAFNGVATAGLTTEQLESIIYTDGELPPNMLSLDFAFYLRTCGPWGQAFPEPVFEGVFEIIDHRVLGEKHLKMELLDERSSQTYSAIYFNGYTGQSPPSRGRFAYELSTNTWRDSTTLQLMVRYMEPL